MGRTRPFLCAALFLVSACTTVPPADESATRLRALLSGGIDALAQGHIVDGMRQLVSVLAERRKLATATPEIEETVRRAEAEISKASAALAMEASADWIDANKNQVPASLLDLGTPSALQPSVVLSYEMGRGKALVPGAQVLFRIVKGGGVLTESVTTNDFGQAASIITRVESQSEELVVRASLVFTVGDFVHAVSSLERDFVYLPSTRRAALIALERLPDGASRPPRILNPVFNAIKDAGFDLSSHDGALLGETFVRACSGDSKALHELGAALGASYLVTVINECQSVTQVVLNGQKYEIYRSRALASVRITRVGDGKILYTRDVGPIQGQGGTEEKAAADGLDKAANELAAALGADLKGIAAALNARP